jgi:hypothetical protein
MADGHSRLILRDESALVAKPPSRQAGHFGAGIAANPANSIIPATLKAVPAISSGTRPGLTGDPEIGPKWATISYATILAAAGKPY